MAITYPILLPLKPAPRSFTPALLSYGAMSKSPFSGAQQVQLLQGQEAAFSVTLPPMSDDQARDWWGALASLRGRYGTFYYGDPKWKQPRGSWAGSPVVDGAGQSGSTLAMRGLTVGATIRAADYFQHGSGANAKLYLVTRDAVADGSGEAQLEIWPALRTSPADGDVLVTSSPKGVFRLASPAIARTWEPFRHGLSFDVLEAI